MVPSQVLASCDVWPDIVCFQETHVSCEAVAQRVFPGMRIVGVFREFGERGGILTVIREDWEMVGCESRVFWAGVVVRRAGCTVCIVNAYIPPRSSSFAPSSYAGVL